MKDDFDYQSVPLRYLHCFNATCPRKDECLRYLTAIHAPKSTPVVMTLNPAAYPKNADTCDYFRSSRKLRLAWGITALFDKIPYATAVALKGSLHQLYSKSTYYRIVHQERPLLPAEQAEIARIFALKGVNEPLEFDRYTEGYDWDEHSLPS